jgi:hypothetical protein
VLLADGFESGLGAWTSVGNVAATSSAASANSGTLSASLATGAGEYAGMFADLAGGGAAVTYTRFCFRLSNLTGSTILAQGRDANGATMWEIDYDNGSKGLDTYFWNGARARTNIATAANLIAPNTWYCAELLLNQSVTGRAELWLSGTSAGFSDGDFSASTPLSRLMLWNNGAPASVLVDDVAVSSSYNGPTGAGAGA